MLKDIQFPLCFYTQKSRHFTLSDFLWKFWYWNLYTKNMTLYVTGRFYIKKVWHFAKSKTVCVTFLCSKIRTLCITRFLLNFWNWRRWGGGLHAKKMHFALHLYIKKQCTLVYALYTKLRHYALNFNMQKDN